MTDTDIVTKLNREADEQVLPKHGVTTYAAFLMHEAAAEIERLRYERDKARKERDKATRLLHVMVEYIYGITPLDKNPKHDCDFDNRPECGWCKFCENWTEANALLYGDEYGKDTDD